MTNLILENWPKEHCPLLNGVVTASGAYFAIRSVAQPRSLYPIELAYEPGRPLNNGSFEWVHVTPVCEVVDISKNVIAVAGEGAMGADGFIALFDSKRVLQWSAFFDFSNPFVGVCIDGDTVLAENNHGELWRIPFASPWTVTIERGRRMHER